MAADAGLHVVPWRNWDEWEAVYRMLYAASADVRAQGVAHVAAWQARGSVPHAVASTVQFVEVLLSMASGTRSETELQLMMAMTITRFVNGLADPLRVGPSPAPVAHVVSTLQLPPVLSDLRHDATHNMLPSVSVLAYGVDQALDWLRTQYWEPQVVHTRNVLATVTHTLSAWQAGRDILDDVAAVLPEAGAVTRLVAGMLHVLPQLSSLPAETDQWLAHAGTLWPEFPRTLLLACITALSSAQLSVADIASVCVVAAAEAVIPLALSRPESVPGIVSLALSSCAHNPSLTAISVLQTLLAHPAARSHTPAAWPKLRKLMFLRLGGKLPSSERPSESVSLAELERAVSRASQPSGTASTSQTAGPWRVASQRPPSTPIGFLARSDDLCVACMGVDECGAETRTGEQPECTDDGDDEQHPSAVQHAGDGGGVDLVVAEEDRNVGAQPLDASRVMVWV